MKGIIERISLDLHSIGAVKLGDFVLSSGMRSPVYLDLRIVPSHPRIFRKIVDLSVETLKRVEFDAICGIATGGLPLSSVIAYLMEKPLIYFRRSEKEHGTMKRIEGEVKEGMNVIVMDDVATTGGSILEAVKALRDQKAVVRRAFVVVDRGQGAKKNLMAEGVELMSITTLKKVLLELKEAGFISEVEEVIKGLE
ncbi:MAG: orotate phosphoribosyltransferase [Candidatus Methanodesulfokora sp.]|nr:MAG: orotate phosphoribosyltransferase [Candidatus Korarchaeota archaeon]